MTRLGVLLHSKETDEAKWHQWSSGVRCGMLTGTIHLDAVVQPVFESLVRRYPNVDIYTAVGEVTARQFEAALRFLCVDN